MLKTKSVEINYENLIPEITAMVMNVMNNCINVMDAANQRDDIQPDVLHKMLTAMNENNKALLKGILSVITMRHKEEFIKMVDTASFRAKQEKAAIYPEVVTAVITLVKSDMEKNGLE